MTLRRTIARLGGSLRVHRWAVAALLAVGAFGLGFVGFEGSAGDRAYRSLQLFTLAGGEQPSPPLTVQIARFLAPAVAAYAALATLAAIFREQLDAVRLRLTRGHVVIAGLGERGVRLARELHAAGYVVAGVERDPTVPAVRAVRARGIPVVLGDARDEDALLAAGVARARHLVAVCSEDSVNASVAAAAARLSPGGRQLTVLVHLSDGDLAQVLGTSSFGEDVRYEFFSLDDRGAAILLDAHPIPTSTARPARVQLVGLGAVGVRLVVHLGRRRLAAGAAPVEVLISNATEAEVQQIVHQVPLLEETVRFRFDDTGPVDISYVCLDTDDRTLSAALRLVAAQDHPVVAVVRTATGMAELVTTTIPVRRARLDVFPVLDRVCCAELVEQGLLESLARAIHGDYVERLAAHRADDPLTGQTWDHLSEELRESNRLAAAGLAEALFDRGWSIVPLADGTAHRTVVPAADIEAIAEQEHERWRSERTAAGWRRGPRDPVARTSPHLLAWAELTETIREDNRAAVRRLPSLLLRAGLQVTRRG